MNKDDERFRVSRFREVNMFGELSHANYVILANAKQRNDGWFYECLTSILLSAFKLEALLNHLGAKVLPFWPELDRLPVGNKISVLCSYLKLTPDMGCRPFQTVTDLFRFRNAVVHGRPDTLSEIDERESGDVEAMRRRQPLTNWEKLCTIEFAEQADSDIERVAEQLWKAGGLEPVSLRLRGHRYSIKKDSN